jgi:hypothetical protein
MGGDGRGVVGHSRRSSGGLYGTFGFAGLTCV